MDIAFCFFLNIMCLLFTFCFSSSFSVSGFGFMLNFRDYFMISWLCMLSWFVLDNLVLDHFMLNFMLNFWLNLMLYFFSFVFRLSFVFWFFLSSMLHFMFRFMLFFMLFFNMMLTLYFRLGFFSFNSVFWVIFFLFFALSIFIISVVVGFRSLLELFGNVTNS